jgi:small subunit ribosomal protein S6
MELEMKRDERIIRFLTVSLDKFAVAYNEKRRREKEAPKLKKPSN